MMYFVFPQQVLPYTDEQRQRLGVLIHLRTVKTHPVSLTWSISVQVYPFSTYNKSGADDFVHIQGNITNICNLKCSYYIEQKTFWQMEKLLILSNNSYCHNVFKTRILKNRPNTSISWKGVTEYHFILTFYFNIVVFIFSIHAS